MGIYEESHHSEYSNSYTEEESCSSSDDESYSSSQSLDSPGVVSNLMDQTELN